MERVFFFDAGGTLIHPARPVGYYYALVARHYGMEAGEEALQQGFKSAWQRMKPRDPVAGARAMDDKDWWLQLVRESWRMAGRPPTDEKSFAHYFEEVYQLFAREEVWRVFPDALQVLETLRRQGVRCGVLSNWDRRLRGLLQDLQLADYFEHLVISSEIGAEKPHAQIFREAEQLFNIAPAQAVLIGDDYVVDGWGARSAGWDVELLDRPSKDLVDVLAGLRIIRK